ncbi:hypothetical protein [Pseudoxanthomonas winnipegensis]|uniref:hypothetical protein n=1 Tax=Pseudoxanthomonas winnipegensis TaxID=2480810 RepID=UPI00103CFA32|nr:hypothetical protein [Pseudoxanthomonas winnipegensis]TBV74797.1 hypothetical protein EYC45_08740 [Pseudoxanthomonas winnipegensis]
MSYTELITTAIAFVALIVSAVALRRAGRANTIAQEANELAQAPANLAKMQLQQEQDRRNKAVLALDIVKVQNQNRFSHPVAPSYKFNLRNDGAVSATACQFEILTADSPLVSQDYAAKLPATLAPGQTLSVLAAVHLGTPSKLDAVVSWTNPDGTQERQERVLTW